MINESMYLGRFSDIKKQILFKYEQDHLQYYTDVQY